MELTRVCYAISRLLPREEQFALADQVRRAAGSIPANIAEGHESPFRREYVRYLGMSHRSLTELETHLLVCEQVGYVSREIVANALAISDEVSRMLRAMRHRMGEPPPKKRAEGDDDRSALGARRSGRPRDQHTERRKRSQS